MADDVVLSGPLLGTAKEAVYEIGMLQYAPGNIARALPDLTKRLAGSAAFMAQAQLNALKMTKKLPSIRIL